MRPAERFAAVASLISPVVLWVCFVLAHLWLGLLNLYGPGYPLGDVSSVYKFWIEQFIANGTIVGIDTQWVYPIVAIVPMLMSFAFGQALYSSTWLTMVMLLDVVAFGVLTSWGRTRVNNAAGWWWVAFLVLLGPIAVGRIDSISIPLGVIGVLVLSTRPRVAGTVLAIATWIKVWPAALLAAIVISVKSRWQVVLAAAGTSLVIMAASFVLGGGANIFSFVSQQQGRGLQVEAPISTPFLWIAAAGAPDARVYYDYNILTFQVTGAGTATAAALMTPLLAIVAAAVCAIGILAVRRGATSLELLAPLSLALVSAFIVFNKVGSPQFEGWLAVPVILGIVTAAHGGQSFKTPAIMVLVIAAMTQAIYPYFYNSLLALNPIMLIAISARNVLLVALFAWSAGQVVLLARPKAAHSPEFEFDLLKETPSS